MDERVQRQLEERPGTTDVLFALPQYLLPHHALGRLVHAATRSRRRWFKDPLIRLFARRFRVDLDEARLRSPGAYPDFASFFTRALRPGARPIAAGARDVVSPVDGEVVALGRLEPRGTLRAKGGVFDVPTLLGGSAERARPFADGSFLTIYLSPRDYHRVHMPLTGTVEEMVCVPGRLFSVNARTTRAVPRLFTRNERVAVLARTAAGPMAAVLVGALFVGGIETVWAGAVAPPGRRTVQTWYYPDAGLQFATGDEFGRFNMGSTVILLFGAGAVRWHRDMAPGARLRMGQSIGSLVRAPAGAPS